MSEPCEVLGLSPDADDQAVRRRYLELVRQNPPDQAPERFAEIRAAYDALCDPVRRVTSELFGIRTTDSLDDIAAEVRQRLRSARLPPRVLYSLAEG